jgi:hypothetical protein
VSGFGVSSATLPNVLSAERRIFSPFRLCLGVDDERSPASYGQAQWLVSLKQNARGGTVIAATPDQRLANVRLMV